MNELLLKDTVQEWIEENRNTDILKLALKRSPFGGIEMKELVQQLQGRKTASKKFPLLDRKNILFPPKLNLEQTSSDQTAEYKADLLEGELIVDITGGFGIDSIYFAQQFKKVIHVEQISELQKTAQHNFKVLGLNHIVSFNADGTEFVRNLDEKADVIYVDPSRRSEDKARVFMLEDLSPVLPEILEDLLIKSKKVMVKLSPMLDLDVLFGKFSNISEIHIVAVKNDVKEVLVIFENEIQHDTETHAVNLESGQDEFSFRRNILNNYIAEYSDLKKYLYEPNSAILKSGGADLLAKEYTLEKLHPNTQLFTSDKLLSKFPGRVFEVLETVKNPKKELRNQSIMAIHRNFPENLKTLKKKFSFHTDGEEPVLFASSVNKVYIKKLRKINFNI